ncbi:MAG: hypothetical protein WBA88_15875 [Pseudaminobacter sp.]
MSSLYPLISTFNRGEISPLLASRVDIDSWRQSLAYCRNFHVLTHGGLRRRSGTRFIAETAVMSSNSRLLPFKFSEAQSYVLEINGGGNMRFLALRGLLFSGASPYAISHPWSAAAVNRVSYTQFNDVAYFAHKSYSPRKLTRSGDTSWALAEAVFKNGPYLPEKTEGTTLKPSGRGSITPDMTSNTAPSGTVTSSPVDANAFKVFDLNKNSPWVPAGTSGEVAYEFPGSTEKVCDSYWVTSAPNFPEDAPISWTVEGFDGSTWVTLDTRDAESGWQQSQTRYYEFTNKNSYRAYKFKWNAVGQDGSEESRISEIGFNEAGDTATAFTLTASSTAGINAGSGFLASDVGRSIRLMGSDGRWRWATIVSRSSATVVSVRMFGHALPDTSRIARWQLGAFSASSGFPAAVALYDERLMWARTNTEPVTVFGSKQGDFEQYGISDPVLTTDGIKITLLSSNMNEILWLADDEDIVTGSAGQIRSIGPSDITQSFSAANLTQRKGPTSGAEYLQPISIGGVTLYVGQGGTKIRELVLGEQNRYVAPELTVLAEHMLKSGVRDWAFAEKPDPTIYVVTNDGLLTAITYDREQQQLGFARHDVGGVVENVAVIPGIEDGFDDVYLTVRRTINGGLKRYIEVMERPFDGDVDGINDAFFVDCGLSLIEAAKPVTSMTFAAECVMTVAAHGWSNGATVSLSGVIIVDGAGNEVGRMDGTYTIGSVTTDTFKILKDGVPVDTTQYAGMTHTATGTATRLISTVTGLSHLEGEEVLVLADGGVVESLVVSAGQITLPYAAATIHVGLEYTSRAVTLPYMGPQQDGVLFGRRRNVIGSHVDVLHTGALKVGYLGTDTWTPELPEQILKDGGNLFGNAIDLQSGFKRCDYDSSWEANGQIVMETSAPLPALIRSIVLQVEGEP